VNILLIEDDKDKSKKIENFLKTILNANITEKRSLKSGLKELVLAGSSYDFILMDMSMPNFDISMDEPEGGTHENFAGRDLLAQMKLREINSKVLIITQYDTFGSSYNKLSLEELKKQLKDEFTPIYQDTIYYNSAQEDWKNELRKKIELITGKKND
jgi:CheY-like chemotaxis protein